MRYADEYYSLSERTSVVAVSLICLLYSYVDKQLDGTEPRCSLQLEVNSFRSYIHTLFQLANIMSLLGATVLYSYVDKQLDGTEPRCSLQLEVNSFRSYIHTLFQLANIMSLLGATVESPTLLEFSLWYMLAFVVMALVISILEFVMQLVFNGSLTIMEFVSEVALFFVLVQCLPIFYNFQRSLE